MMYNAEQKQRFISTIDPKQFPKNYWETLFEKYAPIEEEKKKDLYNFTKTEIFEAHKYQNYRSYETLMVIHINLKNYVFWATRNGLVDDGLNHFDDFSQEEVFSCVNQLQLKSSIVTRDEVVNGVRALDNPRDAYIITCLFEGIRGSRLQDIFKLNIGDFDPYNHTVKLPNGLIRPASDELIHWAVLADTHYIYTYADGREAELFGTTVFKTLRNTPESQDPATLQHTVYRTIQKCFNIMGFGGKVSINSLYISGVIDRVNRIAIENNVTASDVMYTEKLFKELQKTHQVSVDTKKRFLMKYSEFLVK